MFGSEICACLSQMRRVALAVSGGRDSMCMLDAFARFSPCDAFVVHVHHGLRGAESDADERLVRRACERYGLECRVHHCDVRAYCARERVGIEQGARQMRRAIFADLIASGDAERVLTAHHADDRAESILMHMMRGCGLYGLQGMRTDDGAIMRPMLGATRAQIDEYAARNKIEYRDDATNAQIDYTRNHLRHEILPRMETLYPKAGEHIAQLGEKIVGLVDAIERELGDPVREEDAIVIDAQWMQNSPWASYAVARALRLTGAQTDVHAAQIDAIVALASARAGSKVDQGGAAVAYRQYDTVAIAPRSEPDLREYAAQEGLRCGLGGRTVSIGACEQDCAYATRLDRKALTGATLRTPRRGDRLRIGEGSKSLADFLSERKLPLRLRQRIPVVVANGRVLAVLDARAAYTERPDAQAECVWVCVTDTGEKVYGTDTGNLS